MPTGRIGFDMKKLLFLFVIMPMITFAQGTSVRANSGVATNLTLYGMTTNNVLTASRFILTDANKSSVSAAASGAVPIDADGTAATLAQLKAVGVASSTPGVYALSIVGTNITVNVANISTDTNICTLTLTTNVYFAQPSNLAAGKHFFIHTTQNATGTWSVGFNQTYWKFSLALLPVITTNAATWEVLECWVNPAATAIGAALIPDLR